MDAFGRGRVDRGDVAAVDVLDAVALTLHLGQLREQRFQLGRIVAARSIGTPLALAPPGAPGGRKR